MKAVMVSIQPKWCELIASGKKTVEVRKTKPKLETPFKVYIYCTKGNPKDPMQRLEVHSATDWQSVSLCNGKVIGEFICNEITVAEHGSYCDIPTKKSQIDVLDYLKYADGKTVYGWHISDLVIYDKPKELSEFIRICPEWEKEEITNKCLKCEHHFISGSECFAGCDCEGELTITIPPQSWCYVEELGA